MSASDEILHGMEDLRDVPASGNALSEKLTCRKVPSDSNSEKHDRELVKKNESEERRTTDVVVRHTR